ncbi:MAG: sensor histidine kinase [Aristaeellaceae bacterium]
MKHSAFPHRRIHFRHIRTELLVSYVLILLLPAILLGTCFLPLLDNMYVSQREADVLSTGRLLTENMRSALNGVGEVLSNFCSNNEIWNYFHHEYRYPDTSIKGYYTTMRPKLDSYMALHPEILSAVVYTTNPTVVTNESEICYLAPGSQMDLLARRMAEENRVMMLARLERGPYSGLYAIRSMRLYGKTVGVFCVQLDTGWFIRLMGGDTGEGSCSLVDPEGAVILSTREQLMGQPLADTDLRDVTDRERSAVELDSAAQMAWSLPFPVRFQEESWQLILTIPAEELYMVARTNVTWLALLTALMIILMALLSIIFSRQLTRRLSVIKEGIEQVEKGDFSVRVRVEGRDEVATLGSMLNHMTERLDVLVDENAGRQVQIRALQLAEKEAQLSALQSQINPHFLFNTLEAIQYGIETGAKETSEIVQLLARNLRRLASQERKTTSLREELVSVEEYLRIQKFRYGERLRYHIRVDETLMTLCIPNLLLQPLVENAVSHGIARRAEGGTVSISGVRREGVIVLSVHDDGAGMDELTREELRRSLSKPIGQAGGCIGVKNVADRVQLYYEDRAAFTWESQENDHTTMTITIREEVQHAHPDCG